MPSDVPHPRGGKFQSKAQQRMWFARYGQKAGRQVAHNTAPRDYKGSHPINASGIPDRVGKSTSYGGAKKILFPKPTIKKPPKLVVSKPIGKAFGDMEDVWHASVGAAKLRNARNAGLVARKTAATEQARQATVSTNMLNFKASRNNRFPKVRPTVPGAQQRYGGGSIIGKRYSGDDEVTKGVTRQGVAPVLARVAPAASTAARPKALVMRPARNVIGKGAVGEALHTARLVPKALKGGFQAGSGGGKVRAGLADTVRLNSSKALQNAGQAGKFAAQNRGAVGLSTGIVGGSVMGAGLARRDSVDKAHGDPEDSRYYRLGLGSAVLGAGGAGGLGYAAHDALKTSQIARAGSPMGVHNMKNVQLFVADKDEIKTKRGTRHQVNLRHVEPKAVHRADRLARHGVAMTRRGALAGAGGLAALGGAAVLHNRAHERRYN